MQNINNEFRDHIYDLLLGVYELRGNSVPEGDIVKSEMSEGSDCANAYNRMLDAYSHLNKRLGTADWEDPDVEIIINELLYIGRQLALKMFDYGVYYATKPEK